MNEFCQKLTGTLSFLSAEQAEMLTVYHDMVIEKNKVMNLTAITDDEEFIRKHIDDSLSILSEEDLFTGKKKAIDVGTGAGFPGLCLKIVRPELEMVLADSLAKRLAFLDEVIRELGLTGVKTVHGRAEDLGHMREHREKYDLVFARAVANMSTLSEYCLPFVKPGGFFAAYKSEPEKAERAIRELGGSLFREKEFVLEGTDMKRCFLIVKKTGRSPAKYPRKAGTPSKEPL